MRTDLELLADYRRTGSEAAFAEIMARHSGAVLQTCRRITGNVQEAEDAAQAAFLVLARRAGSVRRSLAGWLHGVALRAAWRIVRTRTRQAHLARRAAREEAAKPMTSSDVHDVAVLRSELDGALARLPEPLREAVVLRYLEGRSQEEASRIAGCPQGTLGWRAMEGLNRLRGLLARRGAAVGSAALIAYLAQEAAAATGIVLEAAAAAGSAAGLAEGVIKAMAWVKVKICAGAVVAMVAVAGSAPAVVRLLTPETVLPVPLYAVHSTFQSGLKGVHGAALFPDGSLLALGGEEGTIEFLDLISGRKRMAFRAHEGRINSLAFSPNRKALASGGADGCVRIWDLDGKEQSVLAGDVGVLSVAYSPDGRLLAIGTEDFEKPVRVWPTAGGEERAFSGAPADIALCVAFSADGTLLASSNRSRTITLWDTASGRPHAVLSTGVAMVSIAFSPDGSTLAAAGGWGGAEPQVIEIWDVATRRRRAVLEGPSVYSVAYSPDGRTLAAADENGTVNLWDAAPGRLLTALRASGGSFVAFLPDGKTLVSAGLDGAVRLWNSTETR